jgi:hypothetical protein
MNFKLRFDTKEKFDDVIDWTVEGSWCGKMRR